MSLLSHKPFSIEGSAGAAANKNRLDKLIKKVRDAPSFQCKYWQRGLLEGNYDNTGQLLQ